MLKVITLAVFIPCLMQVLESKLIPPPEPEPLTLELTPSPSTMGPPPDRIHPADVVTAATNLSCTDSSDCPTGYSCRDSNGNIQYVPQGGYGGWGGYPFYGGFGDPPLGTCGCATRPGEVCDGNSDCPKGYDCYRQMSGVCCPPSYCVTTEYAQYWRDYWNNCSPPTCYFPAK